MNHNLNPGPGAIAHNVHVVLRSFQTLVSSLDNNHGGSNDLHPTEMPPRSGFEDEYTRFKMWAGNLAAHQSGRASLDYRLREAPHLQDQVIYLLQDLSQSLQDARFVLVSPEAQPDLQNKDNLDQSGEDEFTDSEDDDISPASRSAGLYADIKEAIDCLLRLSVAIARPAPHERVRVLGAGPLEDISFRETYDIGYVQDKFPNMSIELARILGKALTRRRQFFKYREAHHAKLASGLERTIHGDTSRTEIVPKTVASSLPEHLKTLRDIDPRGGVFDEDNRSDDAMSQTSYATSAGFLHMTGDLDGHGQLQKPPPPLRVPPLPAAAESGPFECPFCYRIVSSSTRAAWKRHVFGDLRPYTCLFQGCTESNADFDRRHLWQAHISQHHWRVWSCAFKCDDGSFPTSSELKHHLRRQHMPNVPEEQLDAVTGLGERPVAKDTANTCAVCGHTVVGLKPYVKHVGRHLEQLALFVLPHLEDGNNSGGDQESDDERDGTDSRADSENAQDVDWEQVDGEQQTQATLPPVLEDVVPQNLVSQVDSQSDPKGDDRSLEVEDGLTTNNDFELQGSLPRSHTSQQLDDATDFTKNEYYKASEELAWLKVQQEERDFREATEELARLKMQIEEERREKQQQNEVDVAEYQRLKDELERRIQAEEDSEQEKAEAEAILAKLERDRADMKQKEEERLMRERGEERNKLEIELKKLDEEYEGDDKKKEERRIRRELGLKRVEEEKKVATETKRKEKEIQEAIARYRLKEEKRLADERKQKETEIEEATAAFKTKEEKKAADETRHKEKEAEEAVAAFRLQEVERYEKEKADTKARNEEMQQHILQKRLVDSGLDQKEVDAILNKERIIEEEEILRPTYTRFSLRYLDVETLIHYNIDFEHDPDPEYVIVKRWVPEWEQEQLWKHTKELRTTQHRSANAVTLEVDEGGHHSGEFEYVSDCNKRSKSPGLLKYLAGARPD